jgi:RNA polymerase sigma-70 factor (ECF subfamily)
LAGPVPDGGGTPDAREEAGLLDRAAAGDRDALGALVTLHDGRIARMIGARLDPRLRERLDPADVLQEIHLEATRRAPGYFAGPRLPWFLWLRLLAGQTLAGVHRHHLGVQARDPRREERRRPAGLGPDPTSSSLADRLVADVTSPSGQAIRGERQASVEQALEALGPLDREVLVLRHFEAMSNEEAATMLGVAPAAAAKRYFRALGRMQAVLEGMGAGPSDSPA